MFTTVDNNVFYNNDSKVIMYLFDCYSRLFKIRMIFKISFKIGCQRVIGSIPDTLVCFYYKEPKVIGILLFC